jgi:hypothetical protein|tara:strand:- start:950 stop:1531 length:582 start_codon:yes stop_codon:yes gene_type:complete
MAIDNGIAINCDDLQATGGITQILLRTWTSTDVIAYGNGTGAHIISSLTSGGGSTATWYNYEFKNETPSLTVNATKENGSTSFECGLSFMLPKMDSAKFHELQELLDECIMAIAIDTSGVPFVIGVSEKYENESVNSRNQTFANLTSMEGGTGAAYNDDNGITVTLMAKQYELPRIFSGNILFPAGTLTATTD